MSVCNRFSLITVAKIDAFSYKTMKFHYLFNEIHLFISFLNNNFMESSIRQRIKDVLSFHNSNTNQLAGDDANFQNRLSRQINHTSTISCDTISRVLSAYPEVSAEWLIRGKGEMILSDNLPPILGDESENDLDTHAMLAQARIEIDRLNIEIAALKKELWKKEGAIEYQKDFISELTDQIKELEKKVPNETKKDIV